MGSMSVICAEENTMVKVLGFIKRSINNKKSVFPPFGDKAMIRMRLTGGRARVGVVVRQCFNNVKSNVKSKRYAASRNKSTDRYVKLRHKIKFQLAGVILRLIDLVARNPPPSNLQAKNTQKVFTMVVFSMSGLKFHQNLSFPP